MRFVYLDETGHSSKEPIAGVAGVVVRPDEERQLIVAALEELRAQVPADFKDGFTFHATDIFNKHKWKAVWTDEDRWSLLDRFASIPRKLSLPVVLGFSRKPTSRDKPSRETKLIHAWLSCQSGRSNWSPAQIWGQALPDRSITQTK